LRPSPKIGTVPYDTDEKAVHNESPLVAAVDRWQSQWSPMTDYTRREVPLGQLPTAATIESTAAWPNVDGWRSVAGVLGTRITLSILYGVSRRMQRTA
jgi:anti-sigma-K factor RskA